MASTEVATGEAKVRNDRDQDSQAYSSEDRWILKYHDVKTRRDVADERSRVRANADVQFALRGNGLRIEDDLF